MADKFKKKIKLRSKELYLEYKKKKNSLKDKN